MAVENINLSESEMSELNVLFNSKIIYGERYVKNRKPKMRSELI